MKLRIELGGGDGMYMFRRSRSGAMLLELICTFTILAILATMAAPTVAMKIRRERQRELRYALKEIRAAIDRYKDLADIGVLGPQELGSDGYPESLEALVGGVWLTGTNRKIRFLRRIPRDPLTNSTDWGLHSTQDDPESRSWGGQNVFDVYTKSRERAPDGTSYADW